MADRNQHGAGTCDAIAPPKIFIGMLLLTLVLTAPRASAQSGIAVPPTETIVARMAQARADNRAGFRPYVVTRNYKMFGKDEVKLKSEVSVEVTFVPPNFKKFSIGQSSGGIGERIVRRILQSEVESAKDYTQTDYSTTNYDFRFLSSELTTDGSPSFILEMLSKRNEKNLLRGKIWVDANTYRIHRFEGVPAKAASWWVKEAGLVLLYSEVAGMWLQTGTEGTAKVRILGPHRLISKNLEYDFNSLDAAATSTETRHLQIVGEQK